jgi:hypothetical protein
MRVAVGGFKHELNPFVELSTNPARFECETRTGGDCLLTVWRDSQHALGGFIAGGPLVIGFRGGGMPR